MVVGSLEVRVTTFDVLEISGTEARVLQLCKLEALPSLADDWKIHPIREDLKT